MDEQICAVLACDENYAIHVAAAISSAAGLANRNYDLDVHVLASALTEKSRDRLERLPEVLVGAAVTVHELSIEQFSSWVRAEHISQAAYLRLRMCDIVPQHYSRLIYIDADAICIEPLDELWTMDLGASSLAGARDTSTPFVSSPRGIASFEELGLAHDTPYFNSGVLVVDIEKWRLADPLVFAGEYVERFGTVQQALDQEILNARFVGEWLELDPRWNASPRLFSIDHWPDASAKEVFQSTAVAARENPAIVHFLGPKKPWHAFSSAPWRDHYFDALTASGWFGSRIEFRLWRLREGRDLLRRRAMVFRRRLRTVRSVLLDHLR